MGHKGSMEARYTTNKGILPDSLIEEMKEAFSRSEEFLDLEKEIESRESSEDGFEKMKKWVVQYVKAQNVQKIVTPEETEKMIEGGWEYVAVLPNGKVVVKKQNSPQQ